ncbi:MAG: hypothetical protein R3194_06520 [Limnobacter sp.]|nr:hypothetical protein [Limnobacter sp.]
MGDFCAALRSCAGLRPEDLKALTQSFLKNAVDHSKFWTACTSTEYWVTEEDMRAGLEQKASKLESAQPTRDTTLDKTPQSDRPVVGKTDTDGEPAPLGESRVADIGLKEAILRSQNAVAKAKSLQHVWRKSMDDAKQRLDLEFNRRVTEKPGASL